jgi:hypothetical protein
MSPAIGLYSNRFSPARPPPLVPPPPASPGAPPPASRRRSTAGAWTGSSPASPPNQTPSSLGLSSSPPPETVKPRAAGCAPCVNNGAVKRQLVVRRPRSGTSSCGVCTPVQPPSRGEVADVCWHSHSPLPAIPPCPPSRPSPGSLRPGRAHPACCSPGCGPSFTAAAFDSRSLQKLHLCKEPFKREAAALTCSTRGSCTTSTCGTTRCCTCTSPSPTRAVSKRGHGNSVNQHALSGALSRQHCQKAGGSERETAVERPWRQAELLPACSRRREPHRTRAQPTMRDSSTLELGGVHPACIEQWSCERK